MRSEVGKHSVAAITIGARGDVYSATLLGEGESERGVNVCIGLNWLVSRSLSHSRTPSSLVFVALPHFSD
jgi:hypothetical protein